jgi:hypothetical protein
MATVKKRDTGNGIGIDPYLYQYIEQEEFPIGQYCELTDAIRFCELRDEIVDRYTGRYFDISEFSELTSFGAKFSQCALFSQMYLDKDGSIYLLREMLSALVIKGIKAPKHPLYIFNTKAFLKFSTTCHVRWSGKGRFLEFESRFDAFLKRHKIA